MCITNTTKGPELIPEGHHTSMHVVKNDYYNTITLQLASLHLTSHNLTLLHFILLPIPSIQFNFF